MRRNVGIGLVIAAVLTGTVIVNAAAFPNREPSCETWEGPSVPAGVPQPAHYYPLTDDSWVNGLVCDAAGDADGTVDGDVVFTAHGAVFDGASSVVIPDRPEFSAATSGGVTVVAVLDVADWDGGSPVGGYVHWLGKGRAGAQEWTFRHYQDEQGDRSRRVSFYGFSPGGGLGAGSYFVGRDGEMVVGGVLAGSADDGGTASITLGGVEKDRDGLAQYDVIPEDTDSPLVLGSRGDNTGYLVGRIRDVMVFDRALSGNELLLVSRWVGSTGA